MGAFVITSPEVEVFPGVATVAIPILWFRKRKKKKLFNKQINMWLCKTPGSSPLHCIWVPRALKSLAVPLHNASVLSCDLSLPRIIHDYTADMLAHANNFSLEAMSATSYLIYLCCVCMWAPHNLYLSVYVHAPEIRFCAQFDSETNSVVNTIWQRWEDTYITVRWVIYVKWTNKVFAWWKKCEYVCMWLIEPRVR